MAIHNALQNEYHIQNNLVYFFEDDVHDGNSQFHLPRKSYYLTHNGALDNHRADEDKLHVHPHGGDAAN